ncbi:MAG: hypothetical protein WCI72_05320 [archaeon]
MANEAITLEHLGIEVQTPENFVFHNEGYMSFSSFLDSICLNRFGRRATYREMMSYSLARFDGAYFDYEIEKSGQKTKHAHIFVSTEIEHLSPLNLFTYGHEETHLILNNIPHGKNLLKKLLETGTNTGGFEEITNEETLADLGGFACLHSKKIPIGDLQNSQWHDFLEQGKKFEMLEKPEYIEALDFWTKR